MSAGGIEAIVNGVGGTGRDRRGNGGGSSGSLTGSEITRGAAPQAPAQPSHERPAAIPSVAVSARSAAVAARGGMVRGTPRRREDESGSPRARRDSGADGAERTRSNSAGGAERGREARRDRP